jgi:hypothetical protein
MIKEKRKKAAYFMIKATNRDSIKLRRSQESYAIFFRNINFGELGCPSSE